MRLHEMPVSAVLFQLLELPIS